MLISEAFDMYIHDHIMFVGQSIKTQEAYIATRKALIARFGDIDICSLTFNDARDWKIWLDKGRSPNTVRNYVINLRVVLRFLKRRNYPVADPDNIPTPKREQVPVDYLTQEEFDDLIEVIGRNVRGYTTLAKLRNIAIAETLTATGLRNAELCSLNRSSIKDNTFTVVGKGSKPRVGFINNRALEAIDRYLTARPDKTEALFTTSTGKRMVPGDVRRVFDFIRKRYPQFAGLHPHTLRHTYATLLLKRRVDIRHVQELLGHSSLNTTAHYTHVVNEDLKSIYFAAQDY